MIILFSPAKKMFDAEDHDFEMSKPLFEKQAKELRAMLDEMPKDKLQKLWGVSDKLMNETLDAMNTPGPQSPALLAYSGIAFRTMAPGVFDDGQWDYINSHLRILSGLYGLLKPLDGVRPYRLEMQSKPGFSLYEYWKEPLKSQLEGRQIVSLASKEYEKAVSAFTPIIRVLFYEEENGKRKEKGVYVKIARGAMVRWMAENRIENPEDMKDFNELGYRFDAQASKPDELVFFRTEIPEKK